MLTQIQCINAVNLSLDLEENTNRGDEQNTLSSLRNFPDPTKTARPSNYNYSLYVASFQYKSTVHVVQVDRNVHHSMMCIKAYLRMWPMFSIITIKSRLVPVQLQRNCNKTCTNMVCIETYMYVYMYLDDIEHGAHWCTSTNADAYHVVLPLHQGH